jgi:hypothetical protein
LIRQQIAILASHTRNLEKRMGCNHSRDVTAYPLGALWGAPGRRGRT